MMLRRSYFVSIFLAFIAAWLGWAAIGGHLGFSRKAYAGVEQSETPTLAPAAEAPSGNDLEPSSSGTALLAAHNQKVAAQVKADGKKPNIVVIWGDDVGFTNLSIYSRGVMGYRTPNIDRIGNEGAVFTDHYAHPSCTAGRAAFITGMYPIRTGLTSVGMVGGPVGMQARDATLAEVLKTQGYATGQFGKNHLGDRNEHLPTLHGFDEFFGNLYHLNTEEEPEDEDYPRDPEFKKRHGPRGVLHTWATDTEDKTVDSRFGMVGKQRIVDTGPLTRKRMETVDEELVNEGIKFMDKAHADGKPFFVWFATTRMHTFTRTPQKYHEKVREFTSYNDDYGAGVIQHDEHVGIVLKRLDEMGIADNTIVIYSSDNGVEHSTFPHGGTTPFRSEKMSTWEGGVRVPMLVRWPGKIKPATELNGIQSHEDVFTTLSAAAGVTDIRERIAKGDKLGTSVKHQNHIDGVNNLGYWTGQTDKSARDEYIYYAESRVQAMRINQWKAHFFVRDGYYGTTTKLDIPYLFNIRQDPYESYDQAPGPRATLSQQKTYLFNELMDRLGRHMSTLQKYPPKQKGSSLSIGN
jgi:arylsulfatase A-like enzyme